MYDLTDKRLETYPGGSTRWHYRIVCDVCGEKAGYGQRRRAKNYCKDCQYARLSEMNARPITVVCENCGREVNRPQSWVLRNKRHFCSSRCSGEARRKPIEEVARNRLKQKMIQAGIPKVCVSCGHDHIWNLQAHHRKPRSQGGEDTLENLEFRCRNCHGDVHYGHECIQG